VVVVKAKESESFLSPFRALWREPVAGLALAERLTERSATQRTGQRFQPRPPTVECKRALCGGSSWTDMNDSRALDVSAKRGKFPCAGGGGKRN